MKYFWSPPVFSFPLAMMSTRTLSPPSLLRSLIVTFVFISFPEENCTRADRRMISSGPTGTPAKAREKRPLSRKKRKMPAGDRTKRFFPIANLLSSFGQQPWEKDDERGE